MRALYLTSVWLHVLAAAAWIGGMVFLVAVLVPVLRGRPFGDVQTELLYRVGLRLRHFGWAMMGLLVATGVANVALLGGTWGDAFSGALWDGAWGRALGAKLVLVGATLSLSAVHDFWVGPRAVALIRSEPGSEPGSALHAAGAGDGAVDARAVARRPRPRGDAAAGRPVGGAAMKKRSFVWRYPLLGLGMMALLAGLCGGLLRLGWGGGHVPVTLGLAHGPLMACGFLGTLISLERAVALGKGWAYAVPAVAGLGGVLAMAGVDGAPLPFTAASLGLVGLYAVLLRMQAEPFLQVMTLGAGAWLVGNAVWLSGAPVHEAVPWWMGFLVLTIAGERLELSRMLLHAPPVERLFLVLAGGLAAALAVTALAPGLGMRLLGVALLALAAWLARYDAARRTVRQAGLTRFIAVCLLAGYAWLGVGGVLALAYGAVVAGPAYDALLHAVFVGFVFSMIFGHAPIIFPAVLGVPTFYRPAFYVPLALLHASLMLRVVGDLSGWFVLRRWGGLLNAAAIVLYLAGVGFAVLAARRAVSVSPAPC